MSDIATFGTSNLTNISSKSTTIDLDSLVFSSGAPPYTITLDISGYFFYGAGIVNNSGFVQSLVFLQDGDFGGGIFFHNSSSAGDMINITTTGGTFFFTNTSSAGSATFDLMDGNDLQAHLFFEDDSTAGNATINAGAGAVVAFYDSSNGGNATLNLSTSAFALFEGSNNAEQMIGNCIGGDEEFSSQINFEGYSSAGEGTFTTIGGSTPGEQGGYILFDNTATADQASFVINGAMGAGLTGTTLFFIDNTTAANAKITANGGVDGSAGGVISFQKKSEGGTASITLNGNAELDISRHEAGGITIGSLSGKGQVFLGKRSLAVGNNNGSTTFSGIIEDGGRNQKTGGKLSKLGTGTLTLTGANTYTGPTTVKEGMLIINNQQGSATGSGSVTVQAGTLGGRGTISGPLTIGSGSGSGAFLAPSAAAKRPTTLSLASTLTFDADATYTCALQASKKKSANDEVVANGVTIASGAHFNFVTKVQSKLKAGTNFTVINNTASTPINGAFANLPDGATISAHGVNFQASYEGGDGNDLTLTVVP